MTHKKPQQELIKKLRAERAELIKKIPEVEADAATLEAQVGAAAAKDPGAQVTARIHDPAVTAARNALAQAEDRLDEMDKRIEEIDRDLEKLQAQADAEKTIAVLQARLADKDGEIAAAQAAVATDKAKAHQYRQEHAEAAAAASEAKDAAAAALVDGRDSADNMRVLAERAAQADALAGAVELLDKRIADGEARISALRAEREVVQADIDHSALHAADAAVHAAWADFLPHLHRWLSATRRAHGYGAAQMPNLQEMHRQWLDAQAEVEEQ